MQEVEKSPMCAEEDHRQKRVIKEYFGNKKIRIKPGRQQQLKGMGVSL